MRSFANYHIQSKDKMMADGESVFQKHLDGFEGFDVKIDNIKDKVVIKQHSNPLNEYKEDRQLICTLSTNIKKGSIVDLTEFNEKWLVISDVDTDKLLKYCKIQKTNNTLTFYKNHISSTPIQIPCIIESNVRLNDMGITETKYTIEPNGVITVKLSNTEITKHIARDDIYKMSEVDNYKVIDANRVIEQGLIILKMEWTAEEQVLPEEEPIIPLEEIVVTPTDTTLTIAKKSTFNARFFDGGIENLSIHFDWIITNEDGTSNTYVNILPNNRTCDITPVNSYSVIGKVVNLKVSLTENPTRFINKQFKIVSLL